MKKRIALIAFVLALSVALRTIKTRLVGVQNPALTAWPAQVIFGFYFAILTLAIQALQRLRTVAGRETPRQRLFLLALIGLCLDLVLVNIAETARPIDASYGPVVLWDVATFFVWLRAIDVSGLRSGQKFRTSLAVMVAPLLKLGRELLFLPYVQETGLAYLDLFFGDLFVNFWVIVCLIRHLRTNEGSRRSIAAEETFALLVFTGCAYWLCAALGNIMALLWSPLHSSVYSILRMHNIPITAINAGYVFVAITVALIIRRWNLLDIGTRFGIVPR